MFHDHSGGFETIDATMMGGSFVVPFRVGGTVLQIVLDTGAGICLSLAPTAVERLSTVRAPLGRTNVRHAGRGQRRTRLRRHSPAPTSPSDASPRRGRRPRQRHARTGRRRLRGDGAPPRARPPIRVCARRRALLGTFRSPRVQRDPRNLPRHSNTKLPRQMKTMKRILNRVFYVYTVLRNHRISCLRSTTWSMIILKIKRILNFTYYFP